MKKAYLIIACLCLSLLLEAQISKTINISAGGLSSVLTSAEKTTITNLTLTGTVDARDFKTMRDDMTVLAVLDLSAASIAEYNGTEGTMSGLSPYDSNLIPHSAFYNQETSMGKVSLTSVILPSSATVIGFNAFFKCIGLTSVNISPSVVYILSSAFGFCTSLKTVTIPSSATTIQDGAFRYCSALTSITIPSSIATIENTVFSFCTGLKSVNIPSSVTSIGVSAFFGCSGLTSLTIPSSVNSIGSWAFKDCTNLSSITVEWTIPLNISASSGVFDQVNKTTCILHIPLGSEGVYQTANQWKDFGPANLAVSSNTVNIAAAKGSTSTIDISTTIDWNAISDQSWLMVSPTSGNGNNTLTFTAEENISTTSRIALVTIAATGLSSQIITITQLGNTKTIVNAAGGLFSALSENELLSITHLIISGTIDARDFTSMRDNMPALTNLDLSGATIVGYKGWGGSAGSGMKTITYAENEIPQYAFCTIDSEGNKGKISLTSVTLPLSTTSIGSYAFLYCTGLRTITIPESVTSIERSAFNGCTELASVTIESQTSLSTIGMYAFLNCFGLTSVDIPASVKTIGERAFSHCGGLISVDEKNPNFSSEDGVLYNKNKTILIQCSASKKGNFIIPLSVKNIEPYACIDCKYLNSIQISSSVETIGHSAFIGCTGLTSIHIPSSVTTLGAYAFYDCPAIQSVYVYSNIPIDGDNPQVFDYYETRLKGTLYVPFGSKSTYQESRLWQDFANIVEFDVTDIDIKLIGDPQISLYPNPATEGFLITGIIETTEIQIFDINGKLLLDKKLDGDEYVSVSSLPQGVYIVRINSKAGIFEKKLVKK